MKLGLHGVLCGLHRQSVMNTNGQDQHLNGCSSPPGLPVFGLSALVRALLGALGQVDEVACRHRLGSVNLTERNWESTAFGRTCADHVGGTPGSDGGWYAGHVVPGGESVGHFGAVIARGELVSAWPEVRRDRTERRQEPLCRTW